MACAAFEVFMLTVERKAGGAVIEFFGHPASRHMATAAVGAAVYGKKVTVDIFMAVFTLGTQPGKLLINHLIVC